MPSETPIAFSEVQQQAVLGHAICREAIFDILDALKLDESWYANQELTDFWVFIKRFRKTYKRPPSTWDELVESIADEDLVKTAVKKTAAKCDAAALVHPWDVLETKLAEWGQAALLDSKLETLAEAYNAGKHQKAFDLLHECSHELIKVETAIGRNFSSFESVSVSGQREEFDRLAEQDRHLPFGVSFLNDCFGAILPTDVVLCGADSGVGKTETAKFLAGYVAKNKNVPVHYFALEAEKDEIARRIKFGIMGNLYRKDHEYSTPGLISYRNFRLNRINEELKPYQKIAQEILDNDYKNLHVSYGCNAPNGQFGARDLEKEIYKIRDNTALVVVDHLHYMDLGENENLEMTNLVKNIRTMSLKFEIPFLLVCHIKKSDSRFAPLVPSKEDYHGSSNIYKVSTLAFTMSRASGYISTDSRAIGTPTFFRVTKTRIDGSGMYNCGVAFFDHFAMEYTPYYSCGHLNKKGDKWYPNTDQMPFWVNNDRLIRNCSEVE